MYVLCNIAGAGLPVIAEDTASFVTQLFHALPVLTTIWEVTVRLSHQASFSHLKALGDTFLISIHGEAVVILININQ